MNGVIALIEPYVFGLVEWSVTRRSEPNASAPRRCVNSARRPDLAICGEIEFTNPTGLARGLKDTQSPVRTVEGCPGPEFAVFSPLRQLRTAAPRRNERRLPGRLEPEIPAQRRIGDPETVASLRPKLAKRSIFLERR